MDNIIVFCREALSYLELSRNPARAPRNPVRFRVNARLAPFLFLYGSRNFLRPPECDRIAVTGMVTRGCGVLEMGRFGVARVRLSVVPSRPATASRKASDAKIRVLPGEH